MVCIIANGKKHYGRLWKVIGKDKDGEIIFDEYFCCSSISIHKEATEIIKEHKNVSALVIIASSLGSDSMELNDKNPVYEIFDANKFREESQ